MRTAGWERRFIRQCWQIQILFEIKSQCQCSLQYLCYSLVRLLFLLRKFSLFFDFAAPDSSATNFRITSIGRKSFVVFWSPPAYLSRNGLINKYQLKINLTARYSVVLPTPVSIGSFVITVGRSEAEQNTNFTRSFTSANFSSAIHGGLEEDFKYSVFLQACTLYADCHSGTSLSLTLNKSCKLLIV